MPCRAANDAPKQQINNKWAGKSHSVGHQKPTNNLQLYGRHTGKDIQLADNLTATNCSATKTIKAIAEYTTCEWGTDSACAIPPVHAACVSCPACPTDGHLNLEEKQGELRLLMEPTSGSLALCIGNSFGSSRVHRLPVATKPTKGSSKHPGW